ncbi:MAG: 23S rRNA pseudouridine(1911/1915/1917) synthase RluD [Steroidobacteraceae bacterium]
MTEEFPIQNVVTVGPEEAGRRLDQVATELLRDYSRARVQGWIDSGELTVDGASANRRLRLRGGEVLRLAARLPEEGGVEPERMAIEVLYQDEDLMVINKAPGVVVHPGAGNRHGTLQHGLLALDAKLGAVPRCGIVHRLDKDTSGVMVIARNLASHTALVAALAEREIEREYVALVMGEPTAGGTVDAAIARHRSQRTRMAVRSDGRAAVTHFRIAERFRGYTLLQLRLETGRTHQIRVHMAHIGHPIIGDPQYGGRRRLAAGLSAATRAALAAFPRQALHAARIALAQPRSAQPIEVTAPVPADLAQLLRQLRREANAIA